MTRLLIKKFIRESRLLFLACCVLVTAFCASRVWIIAQFDLASFEPLLAQLKRFERFMPVPLDQVLTYEGSIALTLSEPILMMAILTWCIARGSDVVSGELGRGTLEMLLANPIGRGQLVIIHAMMSTLGLGLLCLVAWVTIHFSLDNCSLTQRVENTASIQVPFFIPLNIPVSLGEAEEVQIPLSEKVDSGLFIAPCLNLFGLGFVLLSLSILLSCCDRFRWRSIGLALGFYVVQLMLFLLSKVGEAWKWAESLTVLSLYQPDLTVLLSKRIDGSQWGLLGSEELDASVWHYYLGPSGMTASCLLLGVALLTTAVLMFRRRDLPAPL